MRLSRYAALALLASALVPAHLALAQADPPAWKPAGDHIMTRWAKDVRPETPLPEYPRPTLIRARWLNLNGLWNYQVSTITGTEEDVPAESGRILVPFPYESALSGVARKFSEFKILRYQRPLDIPADWRNDRIILHFGAVTWHADVSLNGKKLASHDGGYDPFSFDITDALNASGPNELVVEVRNPISSGGQPRGKQWSKPGGIWYTSSTGIWQTVWLEPVPAAYIVHIAAAPDPSSGEVTFSVATAGEHPGQTCAIKVFDGDAVIASCSGPADHPLHCRIPVPNLWSTVSPVLYTFRAALGTDHVSSYFAFRSVGVAKDAKGLDRLTLNGKPIFMYGPLDQGFWPDGLYTAPTDEALRSDILAAKRMGCNMLRKHVKVEPERFYYWCDKLGILVWQDMPSPFFAKRGERDGLPPISQRWKDNFEHELAAMIAHLQSHPSIVMWVPFNEGWGQNDLAWAKSVALSVKKLDPTRLVNNATGWTDMGVGDTHDIHSYPDPALPPHDAFSNRAAVVGEFGGLGLPLEGHTWVTSNNWGYRTFKTRQEVTGAYIDLINQLPPLIAQGLCAAVYTQTTDVEIECNGWLTYDREVWKVDPDRAATATRQLYLPPPALATLLAHAGEPDSDAPARSWRFTTTDPGPNWFASPAPGSDWRPGVAGFGSRGTPGAHIGTEWTTPDIWIRTEFALAALPKHPCLSIHHDEDAEIYINGQLAARLPGYTSAYRLVPLSAKSAALLTPGPNTLAIHCHQTVGGQYIDCGLVDVVPAK